MVLENLNNFLLQNLWILSLIITWELVWKAIALWKAAKLNHKIWFVVMLVVNTVGIIPIIYLIFTRKKKRKSK